MPRKPDPEFQLLALQIASQLPHDPTEARKVLKLVNALLDDFIDVEDEPPPRPKPIAD